MKNIVIYLSLSNVSYLISILEQLIIFKNVEDCKMLKMVNPLKICILISEILDSIHLLSTQLKTECKDLRNRFLELASSLIEEPKEKVAVEKALLDKDFENREVLDLICFLNYYTVLNNNVVEQMCLKIWNGPHSTQGSVCDTSTFFNIVKNAESVFEASNNVYNIFKRTPDKINTLLESYVSWMDSVKMKYYNYIAIFFIFNLLFQIVNNIFIIEFSKKIDSAMKLYDIVYYFVPNFNSKFNLTLNLNDVMGNATSNKTFQYLYVRNLKPEEYTNLCKTFITLVKIGALIIEIMDGMPFIRNVLIFLMKSSYIYLLSIGQIYFRYFYSKITGKKIVLIDTHLFIDLVIFILVLSRILITDDKMLFYLDMNNLDKYDRNVRIAFVFLMGSFLTLLWLKLLIYLKFSISLGPLLRIVELIFKKLFWFLFIFFGQILLFALIGHILFSFDKINPNFDSIQSSMLYVWQATMQSFNFNGYDSSHSWSITLFLIIHLVFSGIILLNTLTSMISATYGEFSKSSILLLHQDMILKKNEYITDECYGGIILLPFPLNIFNLIFVPIYLFLRKREHLKILNRILLNIGYCPLFICSIIFHILFNALMLPFSFFKLLYILINELILGNNHYQTRTISRINNFLFGLLILVSFPIWGSVAIFWDLILYIRCLYFNVVFDTYYHMDDNEVTPFILNKIGEIFNDKNKRLEIPLSKVITEFVDELGCVNKDQNFKNLLVFGNYPKENIMLIKEYSVFIKFIHQMKLVNDHHLSVVHKKFFLKLCESNAEYVKIQKYIKKEKQISEPKNNEIQRNRVVEINNIQTDNYDYLKTPSENEEKNNLKISKKQLIENLEKIPKLFYKRLSIINLQSCYNSLSHIKNFVNMSQNHNKIRMDTKNIKKNITDIINVLNIKKVIDEKKRTKLTDSNLRRSSRLSVLNTFYKNDVLLAKKEPATDNMHLKENVQKNNNSLIHENRDFYSNLRNHNSSLNKSSFSNDNLIKGIINFRKTPDSKLLTDEREDIPTSFRLGHKKSSLSNEGLLELELLKSETKLRKNNRRSSLSDDSAGENK